MNILMISLGASMFDSPDGNAVRRHIEYAHSAGGVIHMVTIVPQRKGLTTRQYTDCLRVIPVCAARPWGLVLGAIREADLLVRENDYDLIYTQDPFGTALVGHWLRYRHRIPLIIGNHSSFLDNNYWIAERPFFFSLLNWLSKKTLPKADAWHVVNRREREKYQHILGIEPRRVMVIDVPVPIEKFARRQDSKKFSVLRRRLCIDSDAPLALWVGRPVRVKRLPLLLSAFRKVRARIGNARLLLVGNFANCQEDIDAELAANGLDDGSVIRVSEGVPHAELPAYYQMCDLYVHASTYEGFGRVLVEAAVCGLPSVSTATDGASEIVNDGITGRLVPVENVEALADAIYDLLSDRSRCAAMGEAARKRVLQCFDADKNIERRVAMWKAVSAAGVGGYVHIADDLVMGNRE